ncbi:hypothetical protein CERZMDRAFT_88070 [Cercospora zeae-maydis SCOH1-5]|uniref:Uncharacterized protein n=1 Tax=Cercospora zeae-maydis SCOH1-5 TaxID=717836 RepID=A0A6A6F6M0_9PEZI|nr:hypothetical protein CERZMDRAFT_88070 [Cercospora zeae-maydis SCOH1-5]
MLDCHRGGAQNPPTTPILLPLFFAPPRNAFYSILLRPRLRWGSSRARSSSVRTTGLQVKRRKPKNKTSPHPLQQNSWKVDYMIFTNNPRSTVITLIIKWSASQQHGHRQSCALHGTLPTDGFGGNGEGPVLQDGRRRSTSQDDGTGGLCNERRMCSFVMCWDDYGDQMYTGAGSWRLWSWPGSIRGPDVHLMPAGHTVAGKTDEAIHICGVGARYAFDEAGIDHTTSCSVLAELAFLGLKQRPACLSGDPWVHHDSTVPMTKTTIYILHRFNKACSAF